MTRPDRAPEDVDVSRAGNTGGASSGPARPGGMYDYYLGGFHEIATHPDLPGSAPPAVPDGRLLAQANRAFLGRAVRYLLAAGVRQFLHVGSGVPGVTNVHDLATDVAPEARVVCVDADEAAVVHARRLLADDPGAIAVCHDLRRPEDLFADAEVRALLDLDRPVAVLLCGVLHAIPDAEEPGRILVRLCRPLASGSYLAISHGTDDGRSAEQQRRVDKRTATPLTMRRRAAVRALFDGLDLVEPGVVWAPQWRPGSPGDVGHHPELSGCYVGMARKR